jgi:hypothetical protein
VLAGPRALPLALAAAVVVVLPGIATGWMADDFVHAAAVAGRLPQHPGGLDLYDFADGDPAHLAERMQLVYPWWTSPDLKLRFFRPLSSVLSWADFTLWRGSPWVAHLLSLLWYLATVAAVGVLMRRCLGGAVAGLATLLFAIDDAHWMPAVWLANRNALVAAAPALWGLVAWLRYREDGWRPGRWWALIGFAFGLLGGETALGVVAMAAAYELLAPPRPEPWSERILRSLPMIALGLCYVVVYKLLGYGANGSGAYVDPSRDPLDFLHAVAVRVPVLCSALLLGLPAEIGYLTTAARAPLAVAGVLAVGLLAWHAPKAAARLSSDEKRHLRWLLAGGFAALLPAAATTPAGRLLTVPSVAGFALVAVALLQAEGCAEGGPWWRGISQRGERWLKGWLTVAHGVVAPLVFIAASVLASGLQARWDAVLRDPVLTAAAGKTAVWPVPPDPFVGFYAPVALAAHDLPRPRRWWSLTMALLPCRMHRTAADALELEPLGGALVHSEIEQLMHSPTATFRPGDQVAIPGLQTTVLAVDRDGFPTRVGFRFDRPLDDGEFHWFTWRDGRPAKLPLPAVGQSRIVERAPGLLGF